MPSCFATPFKVDDSSSEAEDHALPASLPPLPVPGETAGDTIDIAKATTRSAEACDATDVVKATIQVLEDLAPEQQLLKLQRKQSEDGRTFVKEFLRTPYLAQLHYTMFCKRHFGCSCGCPDELFDWTSEAEHEDEAHEICVSSSRRTAYDRTRWPNVRAKGALRL